MEEERFIVQAPLFQTVFKGLGATIFLLFFPGGEKSTHRFLGACLGEIFFSFPTQLP